MTRINPRHLRALNFMLFLHLINSKRNIIAALKKYYYNLSVNIA